MGCTCLGSFFTLITWLVTLVNLRFQDLVEIEAKSGLPDHTTSIYRDRSELMNSSGKSIPTLVFDLEKRHY